MSADRDLVDAPGGALRREEDAADGVIGEEAVLRACAGEVPGDAVAGVLQGVGLERGGEGDARDEGIERGVAERAQ